MFEICYSILLARRALVLAGVLIAGCCAAWAQSDAASAPNQTSGATEANHPGVDREMTSLTQALSLSTDQQTQVKPLLEAQRQQFVQLRNSGQSRRAARGQFKTILQDTNSKISALLTDDQKPKFEAWQKQQREQRMQRRHGGGGEPQ